LSQLKRWFSDASGTRWATGWHHKEESVSVEQIAASIKDRPWLICAACPGPANPWIEAAVSAQVRRKNTSLNIHTAQVVVTADSIYAMTAFANPNPNSLKN